MRSHAGFKSLPRVNFYGERKMKDPLNIKVSLYVLMQLPPYCSVVGAEEIKDMDRKKRQALRVFWNEPGQGLRKGNFCIETGEYLGDFF